MQLPRLYKAEAIILKRRNVSEADRILTLLSKEYGKIVVVAKGVRKITSHRAPYLEVFSQVTLVLHRGKMRDIITEVSPINGFSNLRKNLTTVNTAYYLCELVDVLLPEKQEQRDVFRFLAATLLAIDENLYGNVSQYAEEFALTLLRLLGFLPSDKQLSAQQIQPFIENIVEKKIKSYQFLTKS